MKFETALERKEGGREWRKERKRESRKEHPGEINLILMGFPKNSYSELRTVEAISVVI